MKRVLLIACVLGMFLAPFRVIADENVTEPYDECYYHSVWVCLVKWADVGPERYWPIAAGFNEWFEGGSCWHLYQAVQRAGAGSVWPQFSAYCQYYRTLPDAKPMILPLWASLAPVAFADDRRR